MSRPTITLTEAQAAHVVRQHLALRDEITRLKKLLRELRQAEQVRVFESLDIVLAYRKLFELRQWDPEDEGLILRLSAEDVKRVQLDKERWAIETFHDSSVKEPA